MLLFCGPKALRAAGVAENVHTGASVVHSPADSRWMQAAVTAEGR